MSKCFAQMREDHKALMKKIKKIKRNLRRRNATHPLLATVTPPEGVGPAILVTVMKL